MESEQSKKRSFVKVDKDIKHYIPCLYARAVFINLCEHRNSITGLCCPNEIDIAKEELMSVWKVNKCIKLLVSLKIITIIKKGKSNGYIINDKDVSYLSTVCGTCDDDDKIDLSHVPHTVDAPLSHVPHTVDHMCHTHTNNMNSKKINKKNNKMNMYVPLHGTCAHDEEITLNLNSEENPMQELVIIESKAMNKKHGNDYTKEFEEFWSIYPKRHSYSNKPAAYRAWKTRIKEGHSPKEIIKNTLNYKQRMEIERCVGTKNVKLPATFLGPDLHFKDENDDNIKNMGVTTNADRKPTNAQDRYNANIDRAFESIGETEDDIKRTTFSF